MSISHLPKTNPSLFEVEQGIALFLSSEPFALKALKQLECIWSSLSGLGKVFARFFAQRQFWKDRFLAPPLVDDALQHLERMKEGDFRKHEEWSLISLASFLKDGSSEVGALVQQKASPAMVEFLSKELPSFQKKKDFFRKKSQKEGFHEDTCVWYRNETFSQYVKRMEERLPSAPFEPPQKPVRTEVYERKVPHTLTEKKSAWKISDAMKRDFRVLKGHILETIAPPEIAPAGSAAGDSPPIDRAGGIKNLGLQAAPVRSHAKTTKADP